MFYSTPQNQNYSISLVICDWASRVLKKKFPKVMTKKAKFNFLWSDQIDPISHPSSCNILYLFCNILKQVSFYRDDWKFWRCGCKGIRPCQKFVSVGGTITFPSCAAPLLRSSGEASSARRQDGRRPVLWANKNTQESGPVPPSPAYCWLSHGLDLQWYPWVSPK